MDGACWGGVGAPGPRTKTSRSSHGQLPLPALAALAGALSPDGISNTGFYVRAMPSPSTSPGRFPH